nr:ribonuclease H-like domain-containing protein [Tanacetum cinerariifolium]
MAKAISSQAWLWHRRLSHLKFDTINLLSKNGIVVGLPKLKFVKDHLCSSCELGKAKRKSFYTKSIEFLNRNLHAYFAEEGILHQIDGENLDKMKEKGDTCIFVGYFTQSRAYRVFNKRTRVIVESIHVNFDELPQMASDHVSSDPAPECRRMALKHGSLSPGPQCQENVTQADRTVTISNELDLLFSLMFDELLNGSSKDVSKSSAVSTADAPNQCGFLESKVKIMPPRKNVNPRDLRDVEIDDLRRQVQQLQEELARVKVVNEEDEVHNDDSDGEEEYCDNPRISI